MKKNLDKLMKQVQLKIQIVHLFNKYKCNFYKILEEILKKP